MAAGCAASHVHVADASAEGHGDEVFLETVEHTPKITALGFSPDGAIVASIHVDNRVRLWEPHLHRSLLVESSLTCLAFSPDGSRLAAATHDNVLVWDVETSTLLRTFPVDHVGCLAFSPDGALLVAASFRQNKRSSQSKIHVMDGCRLPVVVVHEAPGTVTGVEWVPGRQLRVCAADGCSTVLNIGEIEKTVLRSRCESLTAENVRLERSFRHLKASFDSAIGEVDA
jgi:WD40 repeat protein